MNVCRCSSQRYQHYCIPQIVWTNDVPHSVHPSHSIEKFRSFKFFVCIAQVNCRRYLLLSHKYAHCTVQKGEWMRMERHDKQPRIHYYYGSLTENQKSTSACGRCQRIASIIRLENSFVRCWLNCEHLINHFLFTAVRQYICNSGGDYCRRCLLRKQIK